MDSEDIDNSTCVFVLFVNNLFVPSEARFLLGYRLYFGA